jgi:putative aldouronate transport system substrate-binding protein
MSFKKAMTMLLAAVLALGVLASCGGSGNSSAPSSSASTAAPAAESSTASTEAAPAPQVDETDVAKGSDLPRVELGFYMMGDPGQDMDEFYKVMDELTIRDFNCTVRYKFSTWTDYSSKYNLMLTTDNTVDLVYAAAWLDYNSYAKKDAFEDITDLVPQYCPDVWALYPSDKWNGVKVDGKLYAVPQNQVGLHQYVFTYREDLRKKYGLPEMDDLKWDDLENYFKTCLENEESVQFALPTDDQGAAPLFMPSLRKYEYFDAQGDYGLSKCMAVEIANPRNTIISYEQPEYVDFAKRMKKWCDMGFWTKSVLAGVEGASGQDQFKEGTIVGSFGLQLDKASGWGENALREHPDWEVGCIPFAGLTNNFYHMRTDQDLSCIPNGAKNPERALMVLNKMITDREYYDLTQYGILGLNYEFDENHEVSTANIDTDAHGFNLSVWAMRNGDLMYPSFQYWSGREEFINKYKPVAKFDPFDGFVIDVTNIQSEYSAVNQMREEFGRPIEWGLVDDPEAAIATYKEKMKAAGIDKMKEEIDKQIAAYLDSKK